MGLILLSKGRIARHGGEAPLERTRLQIVGGNRTARPLEIGAAVADHDGIAGKHRCAGHEVVERLCSTIRQRVHPPDTPAGLGVDRVQVPVDTRDINASLPDREASVDDVAAGIAPILPVDARIIGPYLAAGNSVERIYPAPIAGRIHDTINDDGSALQPTLRAEL